MEFSDFLATRRESTDIGREPGVGDVGLEGVSGFIYLNGLYIEKVAAYLPATKHNTTLYMLTIANGCELTDDLHRLEQDLFGWALREGYELPYDSSEREPIVARAKREIIADIESGRVPATVSKFSQLHDYVDANYYGGAFEAIEKASDEASASAVMSLYDKVQDEVDKWLRAGRPS